MKTVARMLIASWLAAAGATALGGEGDGACHAKKAEGAKEATVEPSASEGGRVSRRIAFPDAALTDQEGTRVRLLGDVVRDRLVVMDFIFTSCTTVCPLLSGIMRGVQDGIAGASDVALVSITVDPARDTPARLREHAKRWGAKPGWYFLTGEHDAIASVLKAAGAWNPDFTAHAPLVLVGDGRTGRWIRLNGFPKRAQVLAGLQALRGERGVDGVSARVVAP